MKTTWGIIGAIFFVVAVVFGFFFKFDASTPIAIASAAFGFTAIVIGAVNEGKSKKIATWKTVAMIIASAIAGVLCYLGALGNNIFELISSAVLALLAIIFGIVTAKQAAK